MQCRYRISLSGIPTLILMGAKEVRSENEDTFTGGEDRKLREFLTSGMIFQSPDVLF